MYFRIPHPRTNYQQKAILRSEEAEIEKETYEGGQGNRSKEGKGNEGKGSEKAEDRVHGVHVRSASPRQEQKRKGKEIEREREREDGRHE